MYELTVQTSFQAGHALSLPDGSMEPDHVHDWQVQVTVGARDLVEADWVMDFHQLQAMLEALVRPLADGSLNGSPLLGAANPSAERLAEALGRAVIGRLPAGVQLVGVRVMEAVNCWATWRPDC